MNPAVYSKGTRLNRQEFHLEEEFEEEVKNNSKRLFGEKTIYLDTKKKIQSISLGGAIPDGILFDLKDPEDIKFYLVEVELAAHSFYEHIFPQITKFLAFYKNPASENDLIERIHSFIIKNQDIEREFKNLLGGRELYKSIKDAVENNQKILLMLDNKKPEIEEVRRVYTDTWDKIVVPEILMKHTNGVEEVFILDPDFSEIEMAGDAEEIEEETDKQIFYNENYHLEGVEPWVVEVYGQIKNFLLKLDEKIITNPQKYYISFKKHRNFIYLDVKKKKINIAVMLPLEVGQKMALHHRLREFTEGIKGFYGRESFEIKLENKENIEEVLRLIDLAYRDQEE